jgi:mannose-1-phosphate guanylyltransferase
MELYEASIQEAIAKAANGFIVTLESFTKPETGYGYIERKGMTSFLSRKPNQVWLEFIARGNYGTAVCSALKHVVLEELKLYAPEVYETSKISLGKQSGRKFRFRSLYGYSFY